MLLAFCVLCSGSFLKREGRPRDDDVLVARLVDRPIRPMFDKGWCNETQVTGVKDMCVCMCTGMSPGLVCVGCRGQCVLVGRDGCQCCKGSRLSFVNR